MCNYSLIDGLYPMDWLDGQGHGKSVTGQVVRKDICGRSMWKDLYKWIKGLKTLVSHINSHQKVTSAQKEFNNQGDRMTL